MRHSPNLHERHLLDATRQKVISHEQYEGILAIARSMDVAEGNAPGPDLGWFSLLQAGIAALAVGMPGIVVLDRLPRSTPEEMATVSGIAMVLTFGLGKMLEQWSSTKIASSVVLASSVAFSWGVFFGLAARFLGAHELYQNAGPMLDATLLADIGMIAVAIIAVRKRALVAATPGAFAFVHLLVQSVHRFRAPAEYFSHREIAFWSVVAGAIVVCVARLLDVRSRKREDAAFWLHLVGLLAIGFGLTTRVDHSEVETFVWSLAALGTMGLGVWWNRRVYLVCGALAWLAWPALGLGRHMHGIEIIPIFLVTAALLGGFAAFIRMRWIALAVAKPSRNEVRSAWG